MEQLSWVEKPLLIRLWPSSISKRNTNFILYKTACFPRNWQSNCHLVDVKVRFLVEGYIPPRCWIKFSEFFRIPRCSKLKRKLSFIICCILNLCHTVKPQQTAHVLNNASLTAEVLFLEAWKLINLYRKEVY